MHADLDASAKEIESRVRLPEKEQKVSRTSVVHEFCESIRGSKILYFSLRYEVGFSKKFIITTMFSTIMSNKK